MISVKDWCAHSNLLALIRDKILPTTYSDIQDNFWFSGTRTFKQCQVNCKLGIIMFEVVTQASSLTIQ